jgi:predicted amidohydrolase
VQYVAVPHDVRANVERHARFAAVAAARGCQLALFPELSLTGYYRDFTRADAVDPQDPRLAALREIARAHALAIVTGAPVASPRGLHIGAICFLPDGTTYVHLKQHLHEGEEVCFAPGSGGAPLALGDWRVGIAICADIAHPEHARSAAERGCALYAASCFLTPSGYSADCALLEGYAREHDMAVLMANYTGDSGMLPAAGGSALWSPGGKQVVRAPDAGECLALGVWNGAVWSGESLACDPTRSR